MGLWLVRLSGGIFHFRRQKEDLRLGGRKTEGDEKMDVWRLPISASLRGKLISAGYTSVTSLSSVSSANLAQGDTLSFSSTMLAHSLNLPVV